MKRPRHTPIHAERSLRGARPILVGVLAGMLSAGCAASSKPNAPAQESAPSSAGEAGPAQAPPQSPSVSSGDELRIGVDAFTEFERAERDLEATLGTESPRASPLASEECAVACRALGSMQRAVTKLCEIEVGADAARCENARSRVSRAESRVRERCAACAAPI